MGLQVHGSGRKQILLLLLLHHTFHLAVFICKYINRYIFMINLLDGRTNATKQLYCHTLYLFYTALWSCLYCCCCSPYFAIQIRLASTNCIWLWRNKLCQYGGNIHIFLEGTKFQIFDEFFDKKITMRNVGFGSSFSSGRGN
jgi:hypothetical protein